MDPNTLATQERREFADFLAGLDDSQWDAKSLCGSWRVRDVVAHVVAYLDRSRFVFTGSLARQRFQLKRLNAADVEKLSTYPPDRLVDMMRHNDVPRGAGSAFGGRVALVECLIHQQDIRRPLQMPRTIPPERLAAALAFA